jgi:hypothetical protein
LLNNTRVFFTFPHEDITARLNGVTHNRNLLIIMVRLFSEFKMLTMLLSI